MTTHKDNSENIPINVRSSMKNNPYNEYGDDLSTNAIDIDKIEQNYNSHCMKRDKMLRKQLMEDFQIGPYVQPQRSTTKRPKSAKVRTNLNNSSITPNK